MSKNLDLSIRAKLLNIAKEKKVTLDYVVLRYMQEKLLRRISISKFKENFILKGGLFFLITNSLNSRATKDIDFLGRNIINTEEELKIIFSEIISIKQEDGLKYEKNEITCETIKEDADYEGIRVKIVCHLGKIKKNLQIDIGYGDFVYPQINYTKFPSLLDLSIDNIAVYSIESVISEKFEAMIKLSYINSRMKDFYDIFNIIKNYDLNGENVKNAIKHTFHNRNTKLELNLVIFKKDFYTDIEKINQWKNFIKKNKIVDIEFKEVIFLLKVFFVSIIKSIKNDEKLEMVWKYKISNWENDK